MAERILWQGSGSPKPQVVTHVQVSYDPERPAFSVLIRAGVAGVCLTPAEAARMAWALIAAFPREAIEAETRPAGVEAPPPDSFRLPPGVAPETPVKPRAEATLADIVNDG